MPHGARSKCERTLSSPSNHYRLSRDNLYELEVAQRCHEGQIACLLAVHDCAREDMRQARVARWLGTGPTRSTTVVSTIRQLPVDCPVHRDNARVPTVTTTVATTTDTMTTAATCRTSIVNRSDGASHCSGCVGTTSSSTSMALGIPASLATGPGTVARITHTCASRTLSTVTAVLSVASHHSPPPSTCVERALDNVCRLFSSNSSSSNNPMLSVHCTTHSCSCGDGGGGGEGRSSRCRHHHHSHH